MSNRRGFNDPHSSHRAHLERFEEFVYNNSTTHSAQSHPSRQSVYGSRHSSRTVHIPGTKGYEEYEQSDSGAYYGDRCFSRTESDRQGSLDDIRKHPGQKRRRARGGPPDTEDYDSNGRASYNDFEHFDGSGFYIEYRAQSPGAKANVQASHQASQRTETLNGYGGTFGSEHSDWQGPLHDIHNHTGQNIRNNGGRSPDDDANGPTSRGNYGGPYNSDSEEYEASNYDDNVYRAGGSSGMPDVRASPSATQPEPKSGYKYADDDPSEQAAGGYNTTEQRYEAPPQPQTGTYPSYQRRW